MSRTVSQEMSDEQRSAELLIGLKSTLKDKVFVNISHLAQAVGMEVADELAESLSGTTELPNFRAARRSTLRSRGVRSGICQIDRLAAIEAIEKNMPKESREQINKALGMSSTFWQPQAPPPSPQEESGVARALRQVRGQDLTQDVPLNTRQKGVAESSKTQFDKVEGTRVPKKDTQSGQVG